MADLSRKKTKSSSWRYIINIFFFRKIKCKMLSSNWIYIVIWNKCDSTLCSYYLHMIFTCAAPCILFASLLAPYYHMIFTIVVVTTDGCGNDKYKISYMCASDFYSCVYLHMICTWSCIFCSYLLQYCSVANKHRGSYWILGFFGAAIIRGRRFIEGSAY